MFDFGGDGQLDKVTCVRSSQDQRGRHVTS